MDGARIEHGGKYAGDFEVGVQSILNLLDGVDQQCDGAQCEELTNQRNNDTFGGGQCVDGQQAQGGLAVDEDDVVFVADFAQCRGENLLASHFVDQLNFSCGEVDVGGQQVDVLHTGGQDDVLDVDFAVHHDVVDGQVQFVRVRAETGGESTLRVKVDQQHLTAAFCQCRAQVNGGGGLTHAALLIHHRDNAGGTVVAQRSRVGVYAQGSTGGAEFLSLSFSQWFTFINELEVLKFKRCL